MLSERLDAWLGRHELLVDSVIALGLILAGALPYAMLDPYTTAITVVVVLPLVVRRRYPVTSAGLVLAAAFVQWLTASSAPLGLLPADLAVPIAVYSVTAYGPLRAGYLALAAGLTGAVLGGVRWPSERAGAASPVTTSDHVMIGLFLGVPVLAAWAFGRLRGVRREALVSLRERAQLLETERDQRARLAVSAERARIAREMHDVVAHSLAVIIAQADGGRYAAAASPQAAAGALETIGETGRRALGEMRRLLAVLRDDPTAPDAATAPDPATGRPGSPLGPQPGIGDLAELVAQVRAGGLEVTLHEEGPPPAVDAGTGLVVYRIVQEGLTNVLKHAGPAARAEVRCRAEGQVVEVEVLDDGRGAGAVGGPPAAGHGLVGMRERVAACGGTLEVGPRRGGGYAVRASLPTTAATP